MEGSFTGKLACAGKLCAGRLCDPLGTLGAWGNLGGASGKLDGAGPWYGENEGLGDPDRVGTGLATGCACTADETSDT
jgi:hypothetical protein